MVAQRLANVLTRIYDAGRSRKARDSAHQEPTGTVADLEGRHYCVLTTYRRSGEPIPSALWFGVANGKLYFQTGATDWKVKRINHTPEVRIAPSNARGRPLSPPFVGTARVMTAEEGADADRWIQANYGTGRRIYERLLAARVPSVFVEVTPTAPRT